MTEAELKKLLMGTLLLTATLELFEAIAAAGGVFLLEHPRGRGEDPFPSIWILEETRQLKKKTQAIEIQMGQCMFGQTCQKRYDAPGKRQSGHGAAGHEVQSHEPPGDLERLGREPEVQDLPRAGLPRGDVLCNRTADHANHRGHEQEWRWAGSLDDLGFGRWGHLFSGIAGQDRAREPDRRSHPCAALVKSMDPAGKMEADLQGPLGNGRTHHHPRAQDSRRSHPPLVAEQKIGGDAFSS